MSQGVGVPLVRTRLFVPVLILAYVAFATVVAGIAAPGAGMAVLVVGLLVALLMDHVRWHADEVGVTSLKRPVRPDPYGLSRVAPAEPEPSPMAEASPELETAEGHRLPEAAGPIGEAQAPAGPGAAAELAPTKVPPAPGA